VLGTLPKFTFALLATVLATMSQTVSAQASRDMAVVFGSEARSLDPSIDTNGLTLPITNTIVETLARTGKKLDIVPLLAESWKPVASDRWQIKLRRGIKFQNGEPMNADALAFSINVFQKTTGTARGYFSFIKGTEKVDDLTLNIVTDGPVSILPSTLPFLYVFPPKYYGEVGPDGFGKNPIGTGPWKLKTWTKGVELVIEPNPDYWGQKPAIRNIQFRFAPDASSRVAMLLTGEVQLANDIPPAMLPRIETSGNAHLERIKTARSVYLQMNTQSGPTADVRVRRGLNMAVNVESIIKNLYRGHAYGRDRGFIIEGMEGYQGDGLKPYSYDPDMARKLFAEAGFPNGFPLDFWYPIGRYLLDKEASEAIAGDFKKVGIDVTMHGMEPGAYFSKSASERLPGVNFFSCGPLFVNPIFCPIVHFKLGASWGYGANDKTDQYIKQITTEIDPEKRVRLEREFERYIQEVWVPWVWLWHQESIYGVANDLMWTPQPDEKIWFTDMQRK
jgi:peptide/nickel transport system substrate-binding protein